MYSDFRIIPKKEMQSKRFKEEMEKERYGYWIIMNNDESRWVILSHNKVYGKWLKKKKIYDKERM